MQARDYQWQVRTLGAGSPVLLLHAFPYDGRMWDAQMETLAASHSVYVPDMPGFNGAAGWNGAPSIDAWAKSLLSHLARLGVTSAIVAGCSMGGYLLFAMLRANAEFFRGIAVVDSRVIPDSADRKAARLADAERIVRDGKAFFVTRTRASIAGELAAYPAAMSLAGAMLGDASDGGLADALVVLGTRPDSSAQLSAIRVPAIVVRGSLDAIVGRDEARGIAESIGGARFIEIDGAGHIPSFERPHELSAALLDLASRCSV